MHASIYIYIYIFLVLHLKQDNSKTKLMNEQKQTMFNFDSQFYEVNMDQRLMG